MPELASRQHVRDICGVVERALADGGAGWPDSMRWRSRRARGSWDRCWSACRSRRRRRGRLASRSWPSITWPGTSNRSGSSTGPIAAAGGRAGRVRRAHEPLPGRTEGEYQLLGRTRDDAAGEAYNKVAKLLSLGYPGGPIIDRLAKEGNDTAIRWPGTRLTNPDRNAPERDGRFDFSFSGLKTAVLRHVRQRQAELGVEQLPHQEIVDLAASFQRRVVETLHRSHVRRRALARREIDRHRRRRVGEFAACDRTRWRRAAQRDPRLHPAPVALDRQRRDDRRGRITTVRSRTDCRAADLNAAASLPL